MDKAILYIHGKGGNPKEAEYYNAFFKEYDVIGFNYFSQSPWEAKKEFPELFDKLCGAYKSVTVIANSIGAFFAMSALADIKIEKAYFISPVVDMERLIWNMMQWANVTEDDLQKQKEIQTSFGETLSWDYLCYVREHPVTWTVPTHILYGEKDNLTSYETIAEFADRIGATLTVMENGEHWFHTPEQLEFLKQWTYTSFTCVRAEHRH